MTMWCVDTLNSPLDLLLYGDQCGSAFNQGRVSASRQVQPHKKTQAVTRLSPGRISDINVAAAVSTGWGHVDVIEKKDAYEFITDAPGFKPSDVSVELEDKVLSICGKQEQAWKEEEQPKKQQPEQQHKQPEQHQGSQQQQQPPKQQQAPEPEVKVWRNERRMRQFSRAFELPVDANAADISASLDNGVLTVRVAKLPPAAPKPVLRSIAVESAAVSAA